MQVELPADLPPIRTDVAQVQRALVNVLENALKFSPPHTHVILRAEQRGDEIILRVDDQGPGIAPEEAAAHLRAFQHSPGSGGSGLGLAIARGFTIANGGRIWVEPGQSGGASFVLALPAAELAPIAT